MVRIISVASLGFEYGQGYWSVEGLDFSNLLADNPTDDMLASIAKRKSARSARSPSFRKRATKDQTVQPTAKPTQAITQGYLA